MIAAIRHHAGRRVPTLGLAIGALLLLLPTSGVEASPPAGAAGAAPGGITVAQADPAPVETPITFATDQAERGQNRYERDCLECHGDTLDGGLIGGPPLRGLAFEQKYLNGAPASLLFLFMSNLMPPDNPGRYSPSVYVDLMAYIMAQNGFEAGAELPTDVEALAQLTMVK